MKQFLSILAVCALVLPLFVSNAQEHPKSTKDKKECVSKTGAKKGCCPSKAKAAKATTGAVKLQKASHKKDGCSAKEKAACASKCGSKKHASSDKKDSDS